MVQRTEDNRKNFYNPIILQQIIGYLHLFISAQPSPTSRVKVTTA